MLSAGVHVQSLVNKGRFSLATAVIAVVVNTRTCSSSIAKHPLTSLFKQYRTRATCGMHGTVQQAKDCRSHLLNLCAALLALAAHRANGEEAGGGSESPKVSVGKDEGPQEGAEESAGPPREADQTPSALPLLPVPFAPGEPHPSSQGTWGAFKVIERHPLSSLSNGGQLCSQHTCVLRPQRLGSRVCSGYLAQGRQLAWACQLVAAPPLVPRILESEAGILMRSRLEPDLHCTNKQRVRMVTSCTLMLYNPH